jgi:hypothetical protein
MPRVNDIQLVELLYSYLTRPSYVQSEATASLRRVTADISTRYQVPETPCGGTCAAHITTIPQNLGPGPAKGNS